MNWFLIYNQDPRGTVSGSRL